MQIQEITAVLPIPQQELEVELEQQADAIAPSCKSCLFYEQSTIVGICSWHVCFVLPQDKACGHHKYSWIAE